MNTSANDGVRILVLDDDPEIRELLTSYLTKQGFDVSAVGNAIAMDRALIKHSYDLLILDLMLPGEDGLSIAARLKKISDIPIIMLTARGEKEDRIDGLEVGADDYLGKPFHPDELVARIRAVLRRVRTPNEVSDTRVYSFGDYELNAKTLRFTRSGSEVFLTTAEFELLRLFVSEPYRVMDRDLIHMRLTGSTRAKMDRTVDVRITRLRSKIEPDPTSPIYVKTVWRKGYVFCPNAV